MCHTCPGQLQFPRPGSFLPLTFYVANPGRLFQAQRKPRKAAVHPITLPYTTNFYYLYELEIEDEAINAMRV